MCRPVTAAEDVTVFKQSMRGGAESWLVTLMLVGSQCCHGGHAGLF